MRNCQSYSLNLKCLYRSFGSESLLLKPDLLDLNNQRSSQSEPNNEVWRSETVLQVFIDLWMSIDNYSKNNETSISLTVSFVISFTLI